MHRFSCIWLLALLLLAAACARPAPASEEPAPAAGAAAEPAESTSDLRIGLVTDIGNINDGTFNQRAHEGAQQAANEFGLEYRYIETQSQADYEQNIQTLIDEGFNVIVTVGFLISNATFEAAQDNPHITFIGVDQSFIGERALPNLKGMQFREDQGCFLVGAMAGMMTETDSIGFVGAVDISPVKKCRNGYLHGIQYVNPDATLLDVYVSTFTDPAAGASNAEQMIGEGADVIIGAGGVTGSGAISAAAAQGVYVIGVDQDEYVTTFGNGASPGAENVLTSMIKRVDVGVYDEIEAVHKDTFVGNGDYILDVTNGGIGYAPFNEAEAVVPQAVAERMAEIERMLADGELLTGVDMFSGEVIEEEIPEPVPFEA